MRILQIHVAVLLSALCGRTATAIDPYAGNDPFWVLLHEPAVVRELKLSSSQSSEYSKMLDEMDVRFFPLRNKSQDQYVDGFGKITSEVQSRLKDLLRAQQTTRLNEILLQFLGNAALLRKEVASELQLTTSQQSRLQQIASDAETSITALQKEQQNGSADTVQQKYRKLQIDQQKRMLAVLTPAQTERLKKLIGPLMDQKGLRQPRFNPPELIDANEWINSKPLTLKQTKGKVVIVHFYASGCINCIRNMPWYRNWYDDFPSEDFTIVGIHTPETASERVVANVRQKAVDEKLKFPILIDVKSENWNAWGNSMWPAVYLIDRQGYLRDFWAGELNWQGATGEKYFRERIKELTAERKPN